MDRAFCGVSLSLEKPSGSSYILNLRRSESLVAKKTKSAQSERYAKRVATRMPKTGLVESVPRVLGKNAVSVKFGDYRIRTFPPSEATVQSNVAASGRALERIAKKLATPGVLLQSDANIPLYSADSDDPKVMIRKLHGKEERGFFVNGRFEVIRRSRS